MPESNDADRQHRINEVLAEYIMRQDRGETIDPDRLIAEHPDLAETLREYFEQVEALEGFFDSVADEDSATPAPHDDRDQPVPDEAVSPDRQVADSTANRSKDTNAELDEPGADKGAKQLPEKLGRYMIRSVLGEGSFGRVYLAFDPQLQRPVAIKVPHARWSWSDRQKDSFIHEARSAAHLKHPAIVAVHDIQVDGELLYIVQEYIEGQHLGHWAAFHELNFDQITRLIIELAEAIGAAHQQDLVHRDLKPGNVLIDRDGHVHVVDFGLALREDFRRTQKGQISGTPAYMSPEQVRGETHLLDGRSDLWSLGVIFYELLTKRRPFRALEFRQVFEEIKTSDPKPPRMIDPRIPRELERICLKCLAKRRTDRYSSAADLMEDLSAWISGQTSSAASTQPVEKTGSDDTPTTPRVVPKGLRSFDEHDADFFLQLLPGPRDRHDLPESIRFWKYRIEDVDSEKAFAVGLIYGPSGCGKSSLVRAGLLPHLEPHVTPVYVEATQVDTEARLLKGLRRQLKGIPDDGELSDLFRGLREGLWLPHGQKTLIVLDQFEQWLHAQRSERDPELVRALRQCDGGSVQCLLLARDDFWLAVSRFMTELEVDLVQGHNVSLVDLFDPIHAQKVLFEFGHSYGRLPGDYPDLTDAQRQFLSEAVSGLATDGKTVPVRLALFAEMIKGKPWVPETLQEIGGAAGVGVTFLEEMFSATSANPQHRLHQNAARKVLNSLLPKSDAIIIGNVQSYDELLAASEYANRRDFDDLLRILDAEIRLITPTDPEGAVDDTWHVPKNEPNQPDADERASSVDPTARHYQLTHDYLVPSLREWLTQKERETREGRAKLRLKERSELWNIKPENRYLPSWLEHLNIRLLVPMDKWSKPEQTMMRKSARLHTIRLFVGLALILIGGFVALDRAKDWHAEGLVASLMNAEFAKVPNVVSEMEDYRPWTDWRLQEAREKAVSRSSEEIKTSLALLPVDPTQVEYLFQQSLECPIDAFEVIRDSMYPHRKEIAGEFWSVFRNDPDTSRRMRAGMALAAYRPDDEQWREEDAAFLVGELVRNNLERQPQLRELMRRIDRVLLPDLERVFRDSSAKDIHQISAANALVDFAGDDMRRMARLACVATLDQFAIIYPLLEKSDSRDILDELRAHIRQPAKQKMLQQDRITRGRTRAGAAIAMLLKGERESMFDALHVTDDPESLTQFVHRSRECGVTAAQLLDCVTLANASRQRQSNERRKLEDGVLLGLLLALGEFSVNDVPESKRQEFVNQLANWYAQDPSSTIHGACGWLLREWNYADEVKQVDQTPFSYSPDREWFVRRIDLPTATESESEPSQELKPSFFTFIVFEAGEYTIGSQGDEAGFVVAEMRQTVRITHPFAVLNREITRREFEACVGRPIKIDKWSPTPEHPTVGVAWYHAVDFCRWLTGLAGLSEQDQCYVDPKTLKSESFEPDADFRPYPRNWSVQLDRSGYRLPTAAEWEIMCRAGTVSEYSFGNDRRLLDQYGWYADNSNGTTHLPCSLRPNLRGVFDLHGNAWEWCHDWYSESRGMSTEDPIGQLFGNARVFCGGGWKFDALSCRSPRRHKDQPTLQSSNGGFRIVYRLPTP